jgi:hypothetical protein
VCDDFFCTVGCQGETFQQGTCLQTSGGGSAIGTCDANGLKLKIYSDASCTGSSQESTEPVDQCLQDQSGTYVYNVCTSSSDAKKPLSARKLIVRA